MIDVQAMLDVGSDVTVLRTYVSPIILLLVYLDKVAEKVLYFVFLFLSANTLK